MRRILFVCMLMLVAVGTQAQAYQSPVAFIPEQAMVGKKLTVTYGIPGYINDSTCIANDVFLFWCNQDLRYFPMDYPRVSYYAADGVVHKNPAKADSIIRRDIVYIMSIPADKRTEKTLLDIYTVCNKYLHDKSLSDSIESLALSDYPDGIFD